MQDNKVLSAEATGKFNISELLLSFNWDKYCIDSLCCTPLTFSQVFRRLSVSGPDSALVLARHKFSYHNVEL